MAARCSVIPGSRTSPPVLTLPPGTARAIEASLRVAVIFYRRDGSTFTDPLEYSAMLADESYRRVALTHVGDVEVSTVFLGFDHGWGMTPHPILFETMVFGGSLNTYAERWPNEVAALAGHDQWVERVRDLEAIGESRARDAGQASDSAE